MSRLGQAAGVTGPVRDRRASVPVRGGYNGLNANAVANRAAVNAMGDAQALSGLTAAQLDAEQARLRAERAARVAAHECQCPPLIGNAGANRCCRCGGRIVVEHPILRDLALDRAEDQGCER